MAKKTIGMIVEKVLRWHKVEVVLLWLIIAIGAIMIPAGIGIYFNVGKLAVTQQISTIPAKNIIIADVKMLLSFARVLGIVFSLTGIAVIILARDRLSLGKSAHRMASYVQKLEEKLGQGLP